MKKNVILLKIENNALLITSTVLAFIYWVIESFYPEAISTRMITFSLFIVYGFFTQYFVNSAKRMAAEISILSITDHLTGLYNRRGFKMLAEQNQKIAERTGKRTLLMLFADLDQMKSINDNLGHEKGDEALVEVTSILKKVFRESDIIARVGGDEFAVFGIGAAMNDWAAVESRLHRQIDIQNAIENRDYKISLSIGIAYGDLEKHCSVDELMSRADTLMYEEKRSKRLGDGYLNGMTNCSKRSGLK